MDCHKHQWVWQRRQVGQWETTQMEWFYCSICGIPQPRKEWRKDG